MDNGTAAWGQASDAAAGWGEPDEPGKVSSWGTPSSTSGKPGKIKKKIIIQFLSECLCRVSNKVTCSTV